MNIGFTGTRKGMTERQKVALKSVLRLCGTGRFHHGGAEGADEEAAEIFAKAGWLVVVHRPAPPGQGPQLLERNHDIVDISKDLMIAAPRTLKEELRSGTWATIRYSRKSNRPLLVLDP